MNSAFLLEVLNGDGVTPQLICWVLLIRYLMVESGRRGLRPFDWLHLPANMDLVLAMFVFDTGVLARSFVTWLWRVLGAGDLHAAQSAGLIAGGSLIILGSLCKVRALTRPDLGDGPWLTATAVSIVAALGVAALAWFL